MAAPFVGSTFTGPVPTSFPGVQKLFSYALTWSPQNLDRIVYETQQHGIWKGLYPAYTPPRNMKPTSDAISLLVLDYTVPAGDFISQRGFSVTEYDNNRKSIGCDRELSLSVLPGDFSSKAYIHMIGYNAVLHFQINGAETRGIQRIQAGRYFLNARWSEDTDARIQL